MLAALAFVLLAQNREDTFGKSNAGILAMGHQGWRAYFLKKAGGESTAALAGAEALYGEALAWRNDRLFPKTPLRKRLQDTKNDAVEVGEAITGGGTMWNIIAAGLYADAEQALYDVLAHRGRAPARKVSDVTKALDRVAAAYRKADDEPWHPKDGGASLRRLRTDVAGVVAEARRRPRRESDVLLEFCVRTLKAANSDE